jgi:hypothetical protein
MVRTAYLIAGRWRVRAARTVEGEGSPDGGG